MGITEAIPMAMTASRGKGMSAEMNVTPMIDILLVLIIIFMIISPVAPRGEEAQIPQPGPQPKPPDVRTLVVEVLPGPGDHPRVAINRQEVAWAELHGRLYDILKPRAEKVVFVAADKDLDFEPVAQVIDTIRQAGADKVGLMSDQMLAAR